MLSPALTGWVLRNMAQRRMFSLRIVGSARFLKMPIDSQNLYFHLGLHADDDGVVEAYPLMKLLGSNEDNLRVLVSKGFIKILNEDLISFIMDWNEHNLIRADRKVNSIYKDLLLQVIPELRLIEPKPRSDVIDNSRRLSGGQSTDGIGKDRLGKVNKDLIIFKTPEQQEKDRVELNKIRKHLKEKTRLK